MKTREFPLESLKAGLRHAIKNAQQNIKGGNNFAPKGNQENVKALFNRTVSCKLSKGQIISGCVCVVDWSTPPDDYLPF